MEQLETSFENGWNQLKDKGGLGKRANKLLGDYLVWTIPNTIK